MNKIDPTAPAFPTGETFDRNGQIESLKVIGMNVRTYIAVKLMAGLQDYAQNAGLGADRAAACAVEQADALIAELNKPITAK